MITLRSIVALIVFLVVAGCGSEKTRTSEAQASPDGTSASSPTTSEETAVDEAPDDDLDLVEGRSR